MTERYYLPYKSAREYRDRRMAKWMGFFLSEHTHLIQEEANKKSNETKLTPENKFIFIHQAYLNKLCVDVTVYIKTTHYRYSGYIIEVQARFFILKSLDKHYHRLNIHQLSQITLKEEDDGI